MSPRTYCGFWADELNSNQPFPEQLAIIGFTWDQSAAKRYALAMRRKYGINIWVDGTVCTGWKLIVHAADADRAKRMFANV